MAYITFFQFLRRCLLLDAENYTPPETVSKNVGAVLNESGTGEVEQVNGAEQTGGLGGTGVGGTAATIWRCRRRPMGWCAACTGAARWCTYCPP